MSEDMGASPIGDRATHEPSPSVSAVPVGIPSAEEWTDIRRGVARLRAIRYSNPAKAIERLAEVAEAYEAALAHVARRYPPLVPNTNTRDFHAYRAGCFEGIQSFAAAVLANPHCEEAAQAIEARRAETGTGSVVDESAVPQGCAPTSSARSNQGDQ